MSSKEEFPAMHITCRHITAVLSDSLSWVVRFASQPVPHRAEDDQSVLVAVEIRREDSSLLVPI